MGTTYSVHGLHRGYQKSISKRQFWNLIVPESSAVISLCNSNIAQVRKATQSRISKFKVCFITPDDTCQCLISKLSLDDDYKAYLP